MGSTFASPMFGSPMPRLAASGLLATAVSLAPPEAGGAATEIVVAFAPDDMGTVKGLVDAFNESNRVPVTWREMSRERNAHRDQPVQGRRAGAPST